MKDKRNLSLVMDFYELTMSQCYFNDNKDKSLEQAIKCWKYKKSLKGNNKYEKADLKILNN